MDISVLIPTYNCAEFLAEALESAINQTYPPKEILVLDNGSTDNTAEILSAYCEKYGNIRCLTKEHGVIPVSRNMLVEKASCDHVSWLDADDIWTEDKLGKQVGVMERSGCDMVLCGVRNFYDSSVADAPTGEQQFLFNSPTPEYMNGALLKKSVFDKVGLFDPKYFVSSDTDWLIRSKHSGVTSEKVDDVCYLRRVHSNNITYTRNSDDASSMQRIAASLRRVRKK